ncbi:MAG: peptidoglycan-binding protein, partial [Patescibacteria group bacterium]|nr:peptidoglycan-binding protein [Patescibacteria group bacterium]
MKNWLTIVALLLSILAMPASALAAHSLTRGDSGSNVTALQNGLTTLKYLAPGNNNGYFGPKTQAALEKFQCDKGIICSGTLSDGYGVYGPKTQAALQIALAPAQPTTMSNISLTGPATGAFEYSGWLPGWRAASSTADVLPHLAQFKSVMPFVLKVAGDGTLSNTSQLAEEPWASLIAAAKAQKVRVVPTIMWGKGSEIQAVLSDTKKRIALEDAVARLVKQNGFDGIDIDFEAKQAQTINYFSTFLKGLYARMGSKWVYCTVEARMPLEDRYGPGMTIPPDATQYANDYVAMNKYCDRVEIMAYDQGTIDVKLNNARSAPYAPVADPLWVAALVDVAAQSID